MTDDNNSFVTLLAIMGASLTTLIKFNPALAVDKQAQFEPSYFAHSRHTLSLLFSVVLGVVFADYFVCNA